MLSRWEQQFRDNDGDIPDASSDNYATPEEREIARLKRELRDTQDALEVLKNIGIPGIKLAEAVYIEVSVKVEASKVTRRRVSTSGMPKKSSVFHTDTMRF